MFIKECDFKCIKILAKCDTRTEYVYCCHFTTTCLSCEKYINGGILPVQRQRQSSFVRKHWYYLFS